LKRTWHSYLGIWAIALLLFHAVVLIVPIEKKESFFAGYSFIVMAMIGQLVCVRQACRSENAEKFFYRLPLITVSTAGVWIMTVLGGLTMAVPAIPVWVGVVLCLAVLAFTAMALMTATMEADVVVQKDEAVKTSMLFIRSLTVKAERLMTKAATGEAKTVTKRVYEAIRYSDPMSTEALSRIEAQILGQFERFSAAIEDNTQEAASLGEALIALIEERNATCKWMK